jgi:membrane protease YdiL (CAAX protease family)
MLQRVPFSVFYGGLLLIAGFGCLLHHAFSHKCAKRRLVNPWNISWVKFGCFVTGILSSEVFFGIMVKGILKHAVPSLTPEQRGMLIGTAMQLGMLAFLLGLRWACKEFFGIGINTRRLSLAKSFGIGLYQYALAIPLILLTAILWIAGLEWMRRVFHIPFELRVQDIVEFFIHQRNPWILVTITLFACIVAPITEEMAFRAGLYRFLKGKFGDFPALTISSTLFAALHDHWTAFLPLTLLGMILARTYEHFGNIRPAIFLHATFNTSTLILLVLEKVK